MKFLIFGSLAIFSLVIAMSNAKSLDHDVLVGANYPVNDNSANDPNIVPDQPLKSAFDSESVESDECAGRHRARKHKKHRAAHIAKLSPQVRTWVYNCKEKVHANLYEVAYILNFIKHPAVVSEEAKAFLFCYLQQNGMIKGDQLDVETVVSRMLTATYGDTEDHTRYLINECDVDQSYDIETTFKFYECYCSKRNKPATQRSVHGPAHSDSHGSIVIPDYKNYSNI